MTDILIYLLIIGAAVYAFGGVWVVGEYIIKSARRKRDENSKRASPAKRYGACKKNQQETSTGKNT